MDAAPVAAMASLDQGVDLGLGELGGQVGLQQRDLGLFLVGEVGAAALLELDDRFLALLDHLLEDRDHLRVVERDALVDFTLLDRGLHHADGARGAPSRRPAWRPSCPR